ncbi:hypothetical protein HY494_00950 [Candidatus Woesearchaeota archaeon]|nr:hypothetical protein [Candidatus Woesearchaeota archaeon]
MSDQDKILYFLKVVGPTIPSKVAKNIGTEILLASAHLSDLAAQGKVKISTLKIGGTPLYYLPGQEEQLYHFAAGNLNPKDFQVLEVLKQQKILRENSLDLLSKVALRSLKDFTVPLQVTVAGNRELFWKWHLLSDEEASSSIKQILFVREEVREEAKEEIAAPAANEELQSTLYSLPQPLPQPSQSVQESGEISPLSFEQEEYLEENTEQLTETPEDELQEKIEQVLSQNKSKSVKTKRASRKPKIQDDFKDNFLPSAELFLAAKEIVIQEHEIVRKNAEVNLLIKVPSAVGAVTYFCKAKKKAKCDEGDVSAAYMEAQIKKLPLLFLYTYELTKKAQEMLGTEAFQNAVVVKLERGV